MTDCVCVREPQQQQQAASSIRRRTQQHCELKAYARAKALSKATTRAQTAVGCDSRCMHAANTCIQGFLLSCCSRAVHGGISGHAVQCSAVPSNRQPERMRPRCVPAARPVRGAGKLQLVRSRPAVRRDALHMGRCCAQQQGAACAGVWFHRQQHRFAAAARALLNFCGSDGVAAACCCWSRPWHCGLSCSSRPEGPTPPFTMFDLYRLPASQGGNSHG